MWILHCQKDDFWTKIQRMWKLPKRIELFHVFWQIAAVASFEDLFSFVWHWIKRTVILNQWFCAGILYMSIIIQRHALPLWTGHDALVYGNKAIASSLHHPIILFTVNRPTIQILRKSPLSIDHLSRECDACRMSVQSGDNKICMTKPFAVHVFLLTLSQLSIPRRT